MFFKKLKHPFCGSKGQSALTMTFDPNFMGYSFVRALYHIEFYKVVILQLPARKEASLLNIILN